MVVAESAARIPSQSQNINVVNHPLVAGNLSALRAKTTAPAEFRRNLNELSALLAVEASKHWPTEAINIKTPLANCPSARLAKPVVLVPILRAGLGMSEGILPIMPRASVGHLGIYRDEKTLHPVSYYSRLPANIGDAQVLLLDPMLATGFSACEAVSILKKAGAQTIQFLCVISCDAGVAQLHRDHSDIEIITAAIDPELNKVGYIVPGLGDAGDRYFGTE